MRFLVCLFLGLVFTVNIHAQENSRKEDLKIGLVLSGGGAKGLAHIGALKIIEESGVKIDYIGGTSMGAMIGSLYAAGYSTQQLDSIFRATNFRRLIQDDLPRQAKNHYEKEGSQKYVVNLPFDDFKLTFPSGLSRGQNIYNLLGQLMFPVKDINHFRDLPIPFFCMGTDIETGEGVLMEEGSLPEAVAASAAIPSLFTPVEVDGRLISDGGITNNYPIDELKKKGMDFIIGVDVQDDLADRDKLKTVVEIMTQITNFPMIKDMKTKREKTDLYIKPDMAGFTILSFEKGDEIVKAGEEAALNLKSSLDSLVALQKKSPERTFTRVPDSIRIAEIKISGSEHYKRNYIRGKLKIPTATTLSYDEFNEGLNNLSATGNFERIKYSLKETEEGANDLILDLSEAKGRKNLGFGIHYDGLYKSAALINYTHKHLLTNSDRLSLDFIPGESFRYKLSYFIDKGTYWSVGINSSLNQFKKNIRFGLIADKFPSEVNVNKIEMNYLDLTNQLYVETFFLNRNALRFRTGFEHKFTKARTGSFVELSGEGVSEPISLSEEGHTLGPFGYLEYDTYDNPYFPTRGWFFKGNFNAMLFKSGTSFDFKHLSVLKGEVGFASSLTSNLYLRGEASTGLQFGPTSMAAMNFYLGGYGNNYVNNIIPFFGYSFLDKGGNSYIKSSIELDYEVFSKNHLILGYNVANIGDDLYKNRELFELPSYSAIYAGYGMETFVGPLEVYYSFSPELTRSRWFVSLGFWF